MLAQPVPQQSPQTESRLCDDPFATGLTPNRTKPEVLLFRTEPT